MPHLLFVVNDTSFFLSHRLPIAKAAIARGYKVYLAASNTGGLDLIERAGIVFLPIFLDRAGRNPVADFYYVVQLAYKIIKIQPDIIHCVTIKPIIYGGMISRILCLPAAVFAISGLGYLYVQDRPVKALLRALTQWIARYAFAQPNCRIICQNRSDIAILVDANVVRAADVRLIRGSGVDITIFRPSREPEGHPIILLPSRLLWAKGIGVFVEAARQVQKMGVHAEFRLAGDLVPHNPDSIDRKILESWIEEGIINWLGYCQDMAECFRCCHIVCLPTFYGEGLPKSLIEAAASSRPIITTSIPGCDDIVQDGVNGILVPPKDVFRLAEAIETLALQPSLRRRMGVAGRERVVAEFRSDLIVRQTMEIYDELTEFGDGACGI